MLEQIGKYIWNRFLMEGRLFRDHPIAAGLLLLVGVAVGLFVGQYISATQLDNYRSIAAISEAGREEAERRLQARHDADRAAAEAKERIARDDPLGTLSFERAAWNASERVLCLVLKNISNRPVRAQGKAAFVQTQDRPYLIERLPLYREWQQQKEAEFCFLGVPVEAYTRGEYKVAFDIEYNFLEAEPTRALFFILTCPVLNLEVLSNSECTLRNKSNALVKP